MYASFCGACIFTKSKTIVASDHLPGLLISL
jgi:hypothetical protein